MKTFMLVAAMIFVSLTGVYAQYPECPPDDPLCPWGPWEDAVDESGGPYNFGGGAKYRTRTCNGRTEIQFDWSTLTKTNDGRFMDDNSIKDFLINGIVRSEAIHITDGSLENEQYQCPSDPLLPCTNCYEVVLHYSTPCGYMAECKYEVLPGTECCDGGFGTSSMFQEGTKYYVKVQRWISCGVKCCRKIYKFCWVDDNISSNRRLVLKEVKKESVTDCSGEGGTKCGTGLPIPCTGNCN